ncbi:Dipeptidyl-peptidase 7 [Calidithermus terrae]|uniref:Dipeptidyl-peptidase n=1 Tax=Calidithermus terrae TaxID=1408545 RepID=A0A399F1U1_9DEIN|nr:S46 family peptidase [Calidithermus terrae]RIH90714.1 Dipeptidyl-peptidase 7 [Calidithermus terrae]
MRTITQSLRDPTIPNKVVENLWRSLVRLPAGTGFFLAESGLILTNHHVVWKLLRETAGLPHDRFETGFSAKSWNDAIPVPNLSAETLVFVEKAAGATDLSICDNLTYTRWFDVRLIYIPGIHLAKVGSAPRQHYLFDFAILSIFDGNKPVTPPSDRSLRISLRDVREGETLVTAGFTEYTKRNIHPLDLQQEICWRVPLRQTKIYRRLSFLEQQKRFGRKYDRLRGELSVLQAHKFVPLPDGCPDFLDEPIADILAQERRLLPGELYANHGYSYLLKYLLTAVALRRAGGELVWRQLTAATSREKALEWLATSQVRNLDQEVADLHYSLEETIRELGHSHGFVQALVRGRTIDEVKRLILTSNLALPAARLELASGSVLDELEIMGIGAVDQMIGILGELNRLRERICRENERYVRSIPSSILMPDADFSPRVSVGRVSGWTRGDRRFPAILPLKHLIHAGIHQLAGANPRLTHLENIPTFIFHEADVGGGASGSPVVDDAGQVVGLIIGGNPESLAGRWRKTEGARAVTLSIRSVIEMLKATDGDSLVSRLLPYSFCDCRAQA